LKAGFHGLDLPLLLRSKSFSNSKILGALTVHWGLGHWAIKKINPIFRLPFAFLSRFEIDNLTHSLFNSLISRVLLKTALGCCAFCVHVPNTKTATWAVILTFSCVFSFASPPPTTDKKSIGKPALEPRNPT
jgi:hypothetical protein